MHSRFLRKIISQSTQVCAEGITSIIETLTFDPKQSHAQLVNLIDGAKAKNLSDEMNLFSQAQLTAILDVKNDEGLDLFQYALQKNKMKHAAALMEKGIELFLSEIEKRLESADLEDGEIYHFEKKLFTLKSQYIPSPALHKYKIILAPETIERIDKLFDIVKAINNANRSIHNNSNN